MGRIITAEEIRGLSRMVELGEISEEEKREIIISGVPELWVESNLYDPEKGKEPIQLREYQREVLGADETVCLRWGRQLGKEQPYSALVATIEGYKRMGDIELGDTVISITGRPCKVIGTYDQGVKDVYQVVFDDGTFTSCGLEHLWLTYLNGEYLSSRVMNTERIISKLEAGEEVYIPLCDPVVYFSGESIEERCIRLRRLISNIYEETETKECVRLQVEGHKVEQVRYLTQSLGGKLVPIGSSPELYELYLYDIDVIRMVFYGSKAIVPSYVGRKKIVSISRIGREESRCIEVSSATHTYLTNDFIVTHNTVVMSARIAWEAFSEDNVTVAVFAPTKKHLTDVLDYIEKMVTPNPILNRMLVKRSNKTVSDLGIGQKTSSLVELRLINGSIIKFFHTQTKRALEMMRGTRASKLFFDEAAYINEEAFTALSGYITSAENLFIWAQSTPAGKSGWYYEFAQTAKLHSHHVSMESPTWTEEKEKHARMLAPDEGTFRQEYLAEFVSPGWFLFQDYMVDTAVNAAKSDNGELVYQGEKYLSSKQVEDIPGDVYIGLDWNQSFSGVKITIWKSPSFDPHKLIYMALESVEVPTYTQMTAVDRLFELIEKYRPKGVAVDQGYAAGTLEMIDKKLEEKRYEWVKGIIEVVPFGRNIHIPVSEFFGKFSGGDLETPLMEDENSEIKMPVKNFMVSVMSKMLQSGDIVLPPIDVDTERKSLATELRNVKVERISSNGFQVYSKKDLHKFAACMLAVYVFFLRNGNYKVVKEKERLYLRKTDGEDYLPNGYVAKLTTVGLRGSPKGHILNRPLAAGRNRQQKAVGEGFPDIPAEARVIGFGGGTYGAKRPQRTFSYTRRKPMRRVGRRR